MSTRYKNTVIAPSGNFGSLTVSGTQISLQDFTNWDLAHGWGDHSSAGYLTSETTTSLALNTNSLDFTDEDGTTTSIDLSKYLDEDARAIASGTLNSTTGIVTFTRDDSTTFTLDLGDLLDDTNLVTSVNGSNGVVVLKTDDIVDTNQTNKYITTTKLNNLDSTHASVLDTSGDWDNVYTSVLTSSADWETAHGWGNHATQNYLTDYTVTQNDVTQHQTALSITESQISNLGSYITDYTVTEADVTGHQEALHVTTTVNTYSADWETAHSWGNHATQNYLTDYTVTEADVTGHQDALHVTTTVNTYSADWDSTHTTTGSYSANWQSVTTQVNSLSDSWTGGSGGITTIAGATDTDISNPTKGDILVFQNSSSNSWTGKKDRASLESMYNYANNNFYSELGYTGTQLTSIYVWVNSTKNTPLFERDLTYDSNNNLTQVVTKDVQGGSTRQTLTKTLAYDSSNNLINITRVYT